MKILCDVHISFKIVRFLCEIGFEAIHVNQILQGDRTKDADITAFADSNDYAVMTKDMDFQHSHLLMKKPKRLVKITLGNISNSQLIALLDAYQHYIRDALDHENCFIEINAGNLRVISG